MKLSKKSETSSKITFTYDRPPGDVEGYLYHADGKQVSRTFNPNDLEVTFGKVASGKYAVEAVGFDTIARAEWPEVSIPEPPTGVLRWKPPVTTGELINVTAPGTYPANPVSGRDYFFKVNVTSSNGGRVVLRGGRHRVVIGAYSKMLGGNDPVSYMIEEGDANGETFIEGAYGESVNGITIRTNQLVTIQNCHLRVAGAAEHADLIQNWAGQKAKGIRVHRLTGHSAFTFFSDFADEPGITVGTWTPAYWELYDVDLHGPQALNNWMGSPQHAVWKGDNLWLETSFAGSERRDLGDQLRQHGEQYSPKHAGYQILDQTGKVLYSQDAGVASGAPGEIGRTAGHWLRYHQNPRLTMTWKWGVPPGGEFVPASSVGSGYVPPGYQ